jgi:hypothetical protein
VKVFPNKGRLNSDLGHLEKYYEYTMPCSRRYDAARSDNRDEISDKNHFLYLRVPSKRVAIVSRNVFCGANNPLRVGIAARLNYCTCARVDEDDWLSRLLSS